MGIECRSFDPHRRKQDFYLSCDRFHKAADKAKHSSHYSLMVGCILVFQYTPKLSKMQHFKRFALHSATLKA